MSTFNPSAVVLDRPTLALSGFRAISFQVVLIAAAVLLPVVSHWVGAPGRVLLPMHWPVILAGLVYGWRAGLLTGALAPIVSYLFSGFPLPAMLPAMTVELLTYGLVTGVLRELVRLNPFLSVAIALVLGRVVFIISVLLGSSAGRNHLEYFQAALTPGIIAAILQIALLPFLATWWINRERYAKQ